MKYENVARIQGSPIIKIEPPMVRFFRIMDTLGLCRTSQADLLRCQRHGELMQMIRNPLAPLSTATTMRINLLERGYQSILKVSESTDDVLFILFTPRAEQPFFGEPVIRFLRRADLTSIRLAVDFLEGSKFQESATTPRAVFA